jgi:hypothetical protein
MVVFLLVAVAQQVALEPTLRLAVLVAVLAVLLAVKWYQVTCLRPGKVCTDSAQVAVSLTLSMVTQPTELLLQQIAVMAALQVR